MRPQVSLLTTCCIDTVKNLLLIQWDSLYPISVEDAATCFYCNDTQVEIKNWGRSIATCFFSETLVTDLCTRWRQLLDAALYRCINRNVWTVNTEHAQLRTRVCIRAVFIDSAFIARRQESSSVEGVDTTRNSAESGMGRGFNPRQRPAQSTGSFHPGRNPTVSHQKSVDRNSTMPTVERPSISSGFSQYI